MIKQIHKLETTCTSIKNYAAEKPGALDPAAKAELDKIESMIAARGTELQAKKEALVAAKDQMTLATDDLHSGVMQSRFALNMVAYGERKLPDLPRMSKSPWFASRIWDVAVSHRQALESAGENEVTVNAQTSLREKMERFNAARSNLRDRQIDWKAFSAILAEELPVVAGKLRGFKTFATYNVPKAQRKELQNRIWAVVPKARQKKTDEPGAEQVAATLPPIPTDATMIRRDGLTAPLPATPVPQSGEHTALNATA